MKQSNPSSTLHVDAKLPGARAQGSRFGRHLILAIKKVHLLSLLIRHPEVPWPAKVAGSCAIAYVFSPVQLIPSFIPLIGQLDDLLVIFVGTKLVYKLTPNRVIAECEAVQLGTPWFVW
jgi:uncharacterized membrane protein YkvA (DUF1232 family)